MDTSRARALVLVDDQQSHSLLCDYLHRYGADVCETDGKLDSSCDICFVDGEALVRFHQEILQAKQSAELIYIPCILVGDKDRNLAAFRQYSSCIDYILDAPLHESQLQVHIDIALRARRYSLSLNTSILEAAERARYSEERYRVFSELTSDYVYSIRPAPDGTHVLEWATHAFEQRCGYTLGEVNQQGWTILIHPDDIPVFLEREERLNAGLPDVREFRVITKSGETRWVLDHAMPKLEDGKVSRIYGAAKDITEQKLTIMALQASEHKNAEIARLVPVAIYQTDADGRVIYVNERWSQFTGLPLERAYGFGWKDALHPDDVSHFDHWEHSVKQGKTFISEARLCRPDGTIVWAYTWAEPQLADDGTPAGYMGFVTDISERKQAEEKLRTHAEILANMAEGVIVTDEDGIIFFANIAMERIYGYSLGEMLGMHVWKLKAAPEQEAKSLTADIIAILRRKGRWVGEFVARRKNGDVFTIAVRLSRIEIAGKIYLVSVGQDVSELKKAEELRLRLATIVQSTDEAIIGESLDGIVVSWNPAAEAMYGYTSDEICGKPMSILFPADSKGNITEVMARLSQGQGLKNLETKRVRKDGTVIDVSLTLSPIKDSAGKVIGLAKIARDITEKLKFEENLRLWERAIAATSNGIVIVDVEQPGYPAVYANAAFERITGYSIQEVLGRNPEFLLGSDTDQPVWQEIESALREGREKRVVLRNYRKDGQLFWNELSVSPVTNGDGRITHFIAVQNDITERKRYEAELEYQATHDALTKLPNRTLLEDRLEQAIVHAHRDQKLVAAMLINLDRFQIINDSVGHEAGDTLLRQTAERLLSIFGKGNTVARQGGDEFVVVLERVATEQEAADWAQRVMRVMASPFRIDDAEFYISCSIGVGLYPKDGAEGPELLKNAGAAMYRAKERGRNNFQFYTPTMNERARERLEIESALRNALEREEFVLYYQPQVSLSTGTVVGIEALLRWRHPTLGMVQPSRFVGLAEETGLIVPIGAWVLRTACAQAKAWQRAGFGDLPISVNLSPRQFEEDLARFIATVLEETGLPASLLGIELTENMVMTEVDNAISVLNDLRALGVQLSIDDFGTGYSSLSYLKRFPIDVLKIDQSFVRMISPNSNDAAISAAVISMAHSLGMRVIAEGVETEAQCEFLSRHMCDEIQGFLFSEALASNEVEALLSEGRRLPEHLLRMQKPPRMLLLVDDEPNILSALKRLVRRDNYKILTASSGKEGLELLAHNKIDVIVSDQRMPGMTGVEFLRTVKNLYPETVRIVLSGFTELQSVTDAVNEGAIYKFLTKPWDDTQLREHIAQAFQHKEMADENQRLNMEVRGANQELAKVNRQLEEGLQQKQQQIKRDKVTLDIVHEVLQHVPLPVIGLDDDGIVVFNNVAAQTLFKDMGSILGIEASQVMPELLNAVNCVEEGKKCSAKLNGRDFEVVSRSMGNGTQSRGKLIILTPREAA